MNPSAAATEKSSSSMTRNTRSSAGSHLHPAQNRDWRKSASSAVIPAASRRNLLSITERKNSPMLSRKNRMGIRPDSLGAILRE